MPVVGKGIYKGLQSRQTCDQGRGAPQAMFADLGRVASLVA